MIAPFLRERWGWIDTDRCWWCEEGRQSRDHLFKECKTWKDAIRELWETVGNISGKKNREEVIGPSRVGKDLGATSGRPG